MKKAIQIACLMVIALTSLDGHARNINIEVNNVRDDLTSQLREQCARATYNDTVTLNFGKGTFTVSGTVVFKSSSRAKVPPTQPFCLIMEKTALASRHSLMIPISRSMARFSIL